MCMLHASTPDVISLAIYASEMSLDTMAQSSTRRTWQNDMVDVPWPQSSLWLYIPPYLSKGTPFSWHGRVTDDAGDAFLYPVLDFAHATPTDYECR